MKPWKIDLQVVSPMRPNLKHQISSRQPSNLSEKEARSAAIEQTEKEAYQVLNVISAVRTYV